MVYYLYGLLFIAVVIDYRTYKIPNCLIFAGLMAAMMYHGMGSGPPGIAKVISDALLTFFITFPLFVIKALGAGDCKLFGVIAAFTTFKITLKIIFASLLGGVVIGIIKIFFEKIFKNRTPVVSRVNSINYNKISERLKKLIPTSIYCLVMPFYSKISSLFRKNGFHVTHFSMAMLIGTFTVIGF